MNDFGFRVHADAFLADLTLIERQVDRQTAVGLRGVGRQLVRTEKILAPVYKGRGGAQRLRKGAFGPQAPGPIIGLLRFSVKTGRMRKDADGYSLVVGPGGGRVNLYKGKIERKFGFARQAHDEVVPFANVIMAAAWAKALRRGA